MTDETKTLDSLSQMVLEWQQSGDENTLGQINECALAQVELAARMSCGQRKGIYNEVIERTTDKLYDAFKEYTRKDNTRFSSYLSRIIKNAVVDAIRGEKRRMAKVEKLKKRLVELGKDDKSAESRYDGLSGIVDKAVEKLSARQKELWSLYVADVDNLCPYKEIAEKMGIKVGTVKSTVFKIREKLGYALESYLNAA